MGRKNKYSKQDLIEIMKSVGKMNLSKGDIDNNTNIKCSSMTIIRYFGTWKNALNAAELNQGLRTGRKKTINTSHKPNLMNRKKEWVGPIDFIETNNINSSPEDIYSGDIIEWKGIKLTREYLRSINEDDRDEIAKDLLNFFLKFDFIKNYKYREKELITSWNGLKKHKYNIEENNNIKYITNCGTVGYKLYRHFFPNIIKVRGDNRNSIYDVLTNKELLWKTIRNRIGNTLLYSGELNKDLGNLQFPMNISPSQITIGAKNSGLSSMASIFKPNVAKVIYEEWIKDGDIVLDYSAGFGTRLFGLMASNKKNVKYLAYEPNSETYNNLLKVIDFFKFDAEIKKCGSEEEIFDKKVDFAFSSPPYFNIEQYCEEKSQCYNKYPEYNIWLEEYWRKTVRNIKTMLKNNGIFGINIGGQSNKFMQKLEKDINNIIIQEGFELVDTWYMKTSKSHLSSKKNDSSKRFKLEGIFFYKKIDICEKIDNNKKIDICENNIYCGNSLELIDYLDINPNLIILNPPDVNETNYSLNEYRNFIYEIYNKSIDKLSKNGVLVSINTDTKKDCKIYTKHIDIINSISNSCELFNYKIWVKSFKANLFILNYTHLLFFRKRNCINNKIKEFYPDVWNLETDRIEGYKTKDSFPSELVRRIILNFTNEGDVVFDPFLGSGKTAFVSKNLNRKFIGFEIDEKNIEISKKLLNL